MNLSGYSADAHVARRARLTAQLSDLPALVPAGGHVSRNYPAQTYPYRASSHFLYLIGLPLPDAMALVDGGVTTLYMPRPEPDSALWTGELPSFAELAERTGCRVEPLERLSDAIGGRDVGTLPGPDAETRARQAAILGREVQPLRFEGADDRLAHAMITLRLRHDEAAIDGLRRAAEASVAAHLAGMKATRPGDREAVVRAAMEAELLRRNMTTAYGPIVTVHGEVLHEESHHRTMAAGDLLLVDVGAETADGWAGDITRTWPVNGSMSSTQREIYEVVLGSQRAAIEAVAPGVRYRDVHLAACRMLASGLVELGILVGDPDQLVADGVHALLFPHGVGHLLGLDVHDMEDLGDLAGYAEGRQRDSQFGLGYLRLDRELEPGMAVTIEPGFYQVPAILREPRLSALASGRLDRDKLARFADVRGIRIEDDVLVTQSGNEVLTAALPKSAEEIEARVGA